MYPWWQKDLVVSICIGRDGLGSVTAITWHGRDERGQRLRLARVPLSLSRCTLTGMS
jgi:hypothetical protein